MSSLIGFTNLSDVKPFKTGWRVRVKVLHSWKQYTAQSGHSLELILADETGSMIHATCKKKYIQRVERLVPVGEWKVIENFSLTSASGQYRPTSNNFKMAFTDNTSITKCNIKRTDEFIKLMDFETILAGTLNNSFLVDVIGQVVDVKDLEGVQVNGKERKKIEFELRDSNDERMPCCLWERYADQLYTSCQEANGSMVICLIRFAKIISYRGKLQITNAFDTSKLMINPALPEVGEFQKALPDDGLALTSVEPKDDEAEKVVKKKEYWANLPQKTIEELLNSSEIGKCKTVCSICAIDTDWGWYYFGCVKCNRKVEKSSKKQAGSTVRINAPTWWCKTCKEVVTKVSARFKLHLVVMDQTAQTKVMLLDTVASQLVPQSATDLLGGSFEELVDPENIPNPIKDCVGKTYQFSVCVEKENLYYGLETYKVSSVWSGKDNIVPADSSGDQLTQIDNLSTIVSGDEVSIIHSNSDGLSMVSTTPSSKRSSEELEDLPDLSSTSKKLCTKTIKVEKVDDDNVKQLMANVINLEEMNDENSTGSNVKNNVEESKEKLCTNEIKVENMNGEKPISSNGRNNVEKDKDISSEAKKEDKNG